MTRGSRQVQVQVTPGELEEKLNYLEYVVGTTRTAVTSFKNDTIKDQTEDFLRLLEVVKDAVATYRDEVVDQVDIE